MPRPAGRAPNPYAGTYAPSRMGLTKADLIKGLKGLKIKAPNKKLTSTAYKTGLQKESQE